MKKVIWAIMLSVLLLSGCSRGEAEATNGVFPKAAVPETTLAAEKTDRAEYDVVLEDRSLRNENGDVLVESVYEKLVLQGTAPEIAAVNAKLAADCDRFFAESGATTYYEPETFEQMIQDMGMAYGSLIHNAYVTVTHNQDAVFSICISTDWFLGGVCNEDYYGMTFDLRTGERLGLEQLSKLSGEALETALKDTAAFWLRETYGEGLFEEPEKILAEYTLDELLFYVQDGEIILTFPTYTFTAGAAGAAVIPTGIFIETAK